jgi:hypothetical protein
MPTFTKIQGKIMITTMSIICQVTSTGSQESMLAKYTSVIDASGSFIDLI